MDEMSRRSSWLNAFRGYIAVSAGAHLVWEFAQMPLYTVWADPWGEIIFAGLHCAGGDLLIASVCLWSGLLVCGSDGWPSERFRRVSGATIAVGIGYTIFSEWLNVEVRQAWAYADAMPRIPPLGTGITPILQWCVVPTLALSAARRRGCGPSAGPPP
jgi:hypothetical protein